MNSSSRSKYQYTSTQAAKSDTCVDESPRPHLGQCRHVHLGARQRIFVDARALLRAHTKALDERRQKSKRGTVGGAELFELLLCARGTLGDCQRDRWHAAETMADKSDKKEAVYNMGDENTHLWWHCTQQAIQQVV